MTDRRATVAVTYDPGDDPVTLDALLGFLAVGLSAGCVPDATTVSWDTYPNRLSLIAYPDDLWQIDPALEEAR